MAAPAAAVAASFGQAPLKRAGRQLAWGLCGVGKICNDFAIGLFQNESRVRAAASGRGAGPAGEFVRRFAAGGHEVERCYGSYAELFADPEVDVVYVGTIQATHHAVAKAALEAGKHVVVEKPACNDLAEARDLVSSARRVGVFLLEGVWTRFFPVTERAREVLASGRLGPVRAVSADFGFLLPFDASHRLWSKEMGGGSVMALGLYPVQWATFAFGGQRPDRIAAAGRLAATGVDVQGGATLVWDDGAGTEEAGGGGQGGVASLSFGLAGNTGEITTITCERGSLLIDTPAHAPTRLTVVDRNAAPHSRPGAAAPCSHEVFEAPLAKLPYHEWPEPRPALSYPHGEGMLYEVQHVEACLHRGLLESPLYPLEEALVVHGVLAECLRQLGVGVRRAGTADAASETR